MISVVIPYFNAESYVQEALTSVFNQTYRDFEVILVDDGSHKPFHPPRNYPLQCYRIQHSRISAASNFGFKQCRGRYIVFLGADDKLAPTYLERTLQELESTNSDLVYTACQEFGDSDNVKHCFKLRTRFSVYRGTGGQLGAALIKREVIEDVGGFDENLRGYVDWDFTIRAAMRGWRIHALNEPIHFYRRHNGQTNSPANMEANFTALKQKHRTLVFFRTIERCLDVLTGRIVN